MCPDNLLITLIYGREFFPGFIFLGFESCAFPRNYCNLGDILSFPVKSHLSLRPCFVCCSLAGRYAIYKYQAERERDEDGGKGRRGL